MRYRVLLERSTWELAAVTVEADTKNAAREKALDQAGDADWARGEPEESTLSAYHIEEA